MAAWVSWVIFGAVLAIAEVMTLTFVLGMIAIGAFSAAIAAAVGAPTVWQYVIFGLVDAALLGAVLPVARRHRRTPPTMTSGAARLIGSRAMTLTVITTAEGGRVKLEGSEWSARPADDGMVIPAGQWVNVVKIDGATALVQPPAVQTS